MPLEVVVTDGEGHPVERKTVRADLALSGGRLLGRLPFSSHRGGGFLRRGRLGLGLILLRGLGRSHRLSLRSRFRRGAFSLGRRLRRHRRRCSKLGGGLDLRLALPYLAGGLIGGFLGGRIFRKLNMVWLRRAFALLILYGGVRALFF